MSVVATKVAAGSLDDIANQTAKSLVEWAVGPENFGSGDPIGKKTQALLDLAQTNVYAATCVVKLFEDVGLDKDADKYRDLANNGSNPTNPTPLNH